MSSDIDISLYILCFFINYIMSFFAIFPRFYTIHFFIKGTKAYGISKEIIRMAVLIRLPIKCLLIILTEVAPKKL